MTTIRTNADIEIQQLRQFWFTRINGLITINVFANETGVVPEPDLIPAAWLGCWGYDEGYTFACLKSGDLLFVSGAPSDQLRGVFNTLCLNDSGLRVPYFKEQSLYLEDVARRFCDPYAPPL